MIDISEIKLFLLAALLFCIPFHVLGQNRCAWKASETSSYSTLTEHFIDYRDEVIVISVVVHIVAKNQNENISDEQIASQIDVLNEDFRKNNIQIPTIHPLFVNLAADTEIEFCLTATTRTMTNIEGIYSQFSNGKRRVCHTSEGGHDAVSPDRYLNIWISDRSDNALGSATAPGEVPPEEDGVFIAPSYFGTTGTVSPPYHLGRTATHEIGHYFGLQHLWGQGLENDNSCQGDDGIDDTPKQFGNYRNACPAIPMSSCGSPDMFMNFMNYTNDICMALFTPGQKSRMNAVIAQQRSGLLEADCLPLNTQNPFNPEIITIYPIPAKHKIFFSGLKKDNFQLAIFDLSGRLISKGKLWQEAGSPLDVSKLSNGFYLINIWDGHSIYIKKLIIDR